MTQEGRLIQIFYVSPGKLSWVALPLMCIWLVIEDSRVLQVKLKKYAAFPYERPTGG